MNLAQLIMAFSKLYPGGSPMSQPFLLVCENPNFDGLIASQIKPYNYINAMEIGQNTIYLYHDSESAFNQSGVEILDKAISSRDFTNLIRGLSLGITVKVQQNEVTFYPVNVVASFRAFHNVQHYWSAHDIHGLLLKS